MTVIFIEIQVILIWIFNIKTTEKYWNEEINNHFYSVQCFNM
jgi:hypothetical protein